LKCARGVGWSERGLQLRRGGAWEIFRALWPVARRPAIVGLGSPIERGVVLGAVARVCGIGDDRCGAAGGA
jgi:hypothetical protein